MFERRVIDCVQKNMSQISEGYEQNRRMYSVMPMSTIGEGI